MARVFISHVHPVFDWSDEVNTTVDTGEKEIQFEGCGCCSETKVISRMNISEIAATIRTMREIIAEVIQTSGITEEEIARG